MRNIFSKDVEYELLDIVEDAATFFNGGEDGCEVVVC